MSEIPDHLRMPRSDRLDAAAFIILIVTIAILLITAVRQHREKETLETALKTERLHVVDLLRDLDTAVGEIEALRQQLPDRTVEPF